MSTETQVSAATHGSAPPQGADSRLYAPPAQSAPDRAQFLAGRASAPIQPDGDEGEAGLTWDRPTSGDLAVVDQPQPRLRQLMGVCGWAAVLGTIGLVIAVRGFIGDLMGIAPGWYEPSMIIVGIAGIGLTVSAFVTVHRPKLPYTLLGAASFLLAIGVGLTLAAF